MSLKALSVIRTLISILFSNKITNKKLIIIIIRRRRKLIIIIIKKIKIKINSVSSSFHVSD